MMATATLVAVILGIPCLAWLIVDRAQAIRADIQRALDKQETHFYILKGFIESNGNGIDSIREVLTKASAIKAQKQDSVFDRDTITPTNQKPRYVSLAIRRAQAERASLGPVTHDDRVRENNARAMESAG